MSDMSLAPLLAAPPTTQEVPFRGRGFVVFPRPLAAVLVSLAVLGGWEALVRWGILNPLFLPPPSAVAAALDDLVRSGVLWKHLGISLQRLLVGWCLGTLLGLVIGLWMGLWSIFRSVSLTFISVLYPIPKIALLPLMILWLGIGEAPKIVTIALGVFFPTTIIVYSGVDAVPRALIRMAQSFNVRRRDIILKVILPCCMPSIIAGFRITTATALLLLVSAEMIGAEYGIGAFVLQAGNMMATDQLLAGVSVLSAMGLAISTFLVRLERWLFAWR